MTPRDFESLLQDLFDGSIEPDGLRLLEEELRANRASWDVYRDYVHLQGALQHRAEGINLLHVIPMDRVIARRQRRYFRNALLGAAALLVLSGVVAALFIIAQPEPERLALSATADTVWSLAGGRSDSEETVRSVSAGADLSVPSGTLRLEFDSGATMVIQGPASVSFPELEKPVLRHGWLWLDSGGSGMAFEVETPELRVLDIGTRFGVRVPREGPAEVHVIEGKVEVFDKLSAGSIMSLEPEDRAFSINGSGESSEVPLARDPFPELENLLRAPSSYPNTVLGQSPSGYWRLNDSGAVGLSNEVSGGITGHATSGVRAGLAGPRPAEGFEGFEPGNLAADFSGSGVESSISLGARSVHRGVVYRENFEGEGLLDGTKPDVSDERSSWVATSSLSEFRADGRFVGRGEKTDAMRGGSATLPFDPTDGVVYTLEASISGLNGSSGWLGVGFAKGRSSRASKDCRFLGQTVSGRAWMLLTGSTVNQSCDAILGTTGRTGGVADRIPWADWDGGVVDDVDIRIVLDTTGGPGNWTATWYARPLGAGSYTMVRPTSRLLNEDISSVGFAVAGAGVNGAIERFLLRSDVRLPGDAEGSLNERPADISLKEGAVSFWLRRSPGSGRREMLWAAGRLPGDDAVHARLESDGSVGFFMENGRYDVLLTSEVTIADDRWHHVAVSWSPSAVELHIDGRRAGVDAEFRGNQQGKLSEFSFGGGAKEEGLAPFTGWLDEIALWKRPLTPVEVAAQFQSARGLENPATSSDPPLSDPQ